MIERMVPGRGTALTEQLHRMAELLTRRGIPSKLVIGACTEPEFLAHAWVEHAAQPLLWPGDRSLARLVEL